ncbi:TPA: hypothetical protein JAK17_000003 [Corynebacterium striatum]|nr:hypothetical protein [Corynebacterium striatum]
MVDGGVESWTKKSPFIIAFKNEQEAEGECLMVCVWDSIPHKEISQNDYCGTTRLG